MAFDGYGFATGDQRLNVKSRRLSGILQGLFTDCSPSMATGKAEAMGVEAALVRLKNYYDAEGHSHNYLREKCTTWTVAA